MFVLSNQEVYVLLFIAIILLAVALIIVRRARRRNNRYKVGQRIYIDPQISKMATSDKLWVCPQCFQTTLEPGTCQNAEHELTPVKLELADQNKLEYYHEMQRLLGG